MDDITAEFLEETSDELKKLDQSLVALENDPTQSDSILSDVMRAMHSIKGTCGFLGFSRLEKLTHALEHTVVAWREQGAEITAANVSHILTAIDGIKNIVTALRETGSEPVGEDTLLIRTLERYHKDSDALDAVDFTPVAAHRDAKDRAIQDGIDMIMSTSMGTAKKQTIRVHIDILEKLMESVGELVLARNQLLQNAPENSDDEVTSAMQRINVVTGQLQEQVMKARMQPIGNAWAALPRLVRDLSHDLEKSMQLQMEGAETELDRQMLQAIRDPLTHMVRNACDHGIELPEERKKAGKRERGTITLSAMNESGHIVIKLSDDGAGLDIPTIRQKALQLGLVTRDTLAEMTDRQVSQFIFAPAFSTAGTVTELSGRGVGMDVVMNNIQQIGGSLEVSSEKGKGTIFTIHLPLTLAIAPALIIETCHQHFAIPQMRVQEIVRADATTTEHRIENINKAPVLRLRDQILPLVSLSDLFHMPQPTAHNDNIASHGLRERYIVVCSVGAVQFGVLVDKVLHNEEIVVKPIAKLLGRLDVYAGCTVLGDGNIAMILDIAGVLRASGMEEISAASQQHDEPESETDNPRESFLTFKSWSKSTYAVPLQLVTRLEEVDMMNVEWSAGGKIVRYRDGLMRLVTANPNRDVPEEGIYEVLVFADDKRVVGVVAEKMGNIVEAEPTIQTASPEDGIIGTMLLEDRAVDLLDVDTIVAQIYGGVAASSASNVAYNARHKDNQPHVLLVDDSPFFRKFMKPVLTMGGYNVTDKDNAKDALAWLDSGAQEVDIIITDIDMPVMSGLEFAHIISHHPVYKNKPLIALTSHESEDMGEEIELFDAFVTKSNRETLLDVISDVCAQKKIEVA